MTFILHDGIQDIELCIEFNVEDEHLHPTRHKHFKEKWLLWVKSAEGRLPENSKVEKILN
jgi:hypothetical protein